MTNPSYVLMHESADLIRALLQDSTDKETRIRARLHLKDISRCIVREAKAALPRTKKLAEHEGKMPSWAGRDKAAHRARFRQLLSILAVAENTLRPKEGSRVSH